MSFEADAIRLQLNCGGISVDLASRDAAVLEYVAEYFDPWFQPTPAPPEWTVTITSSTTAYAELLRRMPPDAGLQACFAHDREVLALPAVYLDGATCVSDTERSCCVVFRPGQIDLVGDPGTRRWRFTLVWTLLELAATCLRRRHLDLHAAAVEHAGNALLIVGPKRSGKTSVALQLMRTCGWRLVANDRSFVRSEGGRPLVVGVPTAIKIRAPIENRFPELRTGLPQVARPYLYGRTELANAGSISERCDGIDFALTPNQVAARLATGTALAARLSAIVFPQVCEDEPVFTLERVAPTAVIDAIQANFYGASNRNRDATIFEAFGGGCREPSPRWTSAVADSVAGYRLRLGRAAYEGEALGESLFRLLEGPELQVR